ncbi:MAG: hypothetical protein H0T62_06745 [Parachlamydiaceae bacterium]|nr:hypothetical protein [Parachlamydiaceae bacterium]
MISPIEEKKYSGPYMGNIFSNLTLDRGETFEAIEEKNVKQTCTNALENAQKLFYSINDSIRLPESQNFSLKDRISQLNNAEIDNLASLLSILTGKVGENVKILFDDMNRIIEKMSNIPSEHEIEFRDNALIENSNRLIKSMLAINSSFTLLKDGIENEIKCLGSKVAFSSFMDPLKNYQKFYQDAYNEIQKKSILCQELITKTEMRASEDYYKKHVPCTSSTKLFSGSTGIIPKKLKKLFKNYHLRSEEIILLPQKLKDAHALMGILEAEFRKQYSYWAYLCAEKLHPDDSWSFSLSTKHPFNVSYALGYYSYIDHVLNFSKEGLLLKLHPNDPQIIETGLASKFLNSELQINFYQESEKLRNSENIPLYPQENLIDTSFTMDNTLSEVGLNNILQGEENIIEIAHKLLLNINVPKKIIENHEVFLRNRICNLTFLDIEGLVKLISILSLKLSQNEANTFNNMKFMGNSLCKLPSGHDIVVKDNALIDNSNDLINCMTTIKASFIILRNGIKRELERLKTSHFSNFQKPLIEYQQFYTKVSNEIKNELLLCEQLIKDTGSRASEDYYRKYTPSTRSINLFSKATGITQAGLLKTVTQYHERSEEIALLSKKLLEVRQLLEKEVMDFRKKYCFLAYLCAEQIQPDNSWQFLGSKKLFYTQYAIGSASLNYIDQPLNFSLNGLLSKLHFEEPDGEQYLMHNNSEDFSSHSVNQNKLYASGSFSISDEITDITGSRESTEF